MLNRSSTRLERGTASDLFLLSGGPAQPGEHPWIVLPEASQRTPFFGFSLGHRHLLHLHALLLIFSASLLHILSLEIYLHPPFPSTRYKTSTRGSERSSLWHTPSPCSSCRSPSVFLSSLSLCLVSSKISWSLVCLNIHTPYKLSSLCCLYFCANSLSIFITAFGRFLSTSTSINTGVVLYCVSFLLNPSIPQHSGRSTKEQSTPRNSTLLHFHPISNHHSTYRQSQPLWAQTPPLSRQEFLRRTHLGLMSHSE